MSSWHLSQNTARAMPPVERDHPRISKAGVPSRLAPRAASGRSSAYSFGHFRPRRRHPVRGNAAFTERRVRPAPETGHGAGVTAIARDIPTSRSAPTPYEIRARLGGGRGAAELVAYDLRSLTPVRHVATMTTWGPSRSGHDEGGGSP